MGGPRAARLPVGSAPWVSEERSSALQIAQTEVEEFSFSAKNEFDWLNEHMADIFSENQINVAEIFKTPGKLRGKTPRTVRKANPTENRVPLSDIFSSTPKGAPSPFIIPNGDRNNTLRVKIAVDPEPSPAKANIPASPTKPTASPQPTTSKQVVSIVDSGYHGSQSQDAMDVDDADFQEEPTIPFDTQERMEDDRVAFYTSPQQPDRSPARTSPEPTVENMAVDVETQFFTAHVAAETPPPPHPVEAQESTTPAGSPATRQFLATSSAQSTPTKSSSPKPGPAASEQTEAEQDVMENALEEASGSPSDGSSPIRPIVRKSSLNFASLPAREPITHKSIGNRISRTSHLDQTRTSYYHLPTGGKSLGHARQESSDDENDDDDDDMDSDEEPAPQKSQPVTEPENASTHNKTYTQRLQDQISKLGQTQAKPPRPSKSIPDAAAYPQLPTATSNPQPQPQNNPLPSPKKPTTPGAFPEDDDEEDWIQPLGSPDNASGAFSPRPGIHKSYTADVMEGLAGKETVGGSDFTMPKTQPRTSRSKSPEHPPPVPEKTASVFGHHKSASVPMLPPMNLSSDDDTSGLKKTVSVSNPPLDTVYESERPTTPKSPSRGFRDSPLRQVKNKLSSIFKSSKGLLASSAAISAEGKSSLLSPSTSRLGMHGAPSTESLQQTITKDSQPLYPDLSRHATDNKSITTVTSPARTEGRRTRASIEREKAEEKRREKEAKEVRRAAEQMEKLEKAREKEREKARVFSKEQDRVAAMEKQATMQKEQEKKTVPPTPSQPPKTTRTSPRKTKAQLEAEEKATAAATSDDQPTDDIEMVDASNTMPPPSVPRSASALRSAPPASATKGRELKRPMKPAKETAGKAKQAPTVIRVNMNSQNSQHHPPNSALSANLHDTLTPSNPQVQPKSKASQPSMQGKVSLQSLKSSVSSSGRPKALEIAARRKEQEEREAQRKRDAKAEMERKRAAMQEEERRQEQQRKLEAERQREEERKQVEAKKNAQRQAMLEKAKQTRAPPPAVRNQLNGPPEYGRSQDQPQKGEARPPSRMNMAASRSQEELGRPVNATLSTTSKASSKRPLQQDEPADKAARQAPSRPGTTYQTKESKRMRMTDEFDDDLPPANQSSLKGAPIRPSGGYKKDIPSKSMFPAGYTNAPPSATRDLFKTTVTNQHNSHIKAAHPLDMAQFSKGAIPFAPNPNPAGPSTHKTPARPQGVAGVKSAAKSTTKSSPRFQNGESIELPEINTDDEDDDDEDDSGKDVMAAWADSPELRRALVEQESKDPFQIFGAPAPLNMEEVFAKSKDRFHKFRARTSSANWSGHDRLTDEDIRKDLAARDRMRRDGGWTYEMSRELA